MSYIATRLKTTLALSQNISSLSTYLFLSHGRSQLEPQKKKNIDPQKQHLLLNKRQLLGRFPATCFCYSTKFTLYVSPSLPFILHSLARIHRVHHICHTLLSYQHYYRSQIHTQIYRQGLECSMERGTEDMDRHIINRRRNKQRMPIDMSPFQMLIHGLGLVGGVKEKRGNPYHQIIFHKTESH